ncbi:MAG: protein CapI [Ideonella sp. MAG2]|nr:MAG: protein CapI [Ideonella sp. MAG2]
MTSALPAHPPTGQRYLVTGVAGFIGMHTAAALLAQGHEVLGLDSLNDYYQVSLKQDRLKTLLGQARFEFQATDIAETGALLSEFKRYQPTHVIHLAAQPGVRYSLENPDAYVRANLQGFMNVLEACRHLPVEHLVYASSSSVYGGNMKTPFCETDAVDHPVSLYAATKKSNELMAHAYSHLYNIPTTGLRFFTVYGPWGRPDMAPWLFTSAILEGREIKVFNHGQMLRDFTFVGDIVESVVRVAAKPAQPLPGYDPMQPSAPESHAPYRVFNIGNRQPVPLMTFISTLADAIGTAPKMVMLPMQPGDVLVTSANTDRLESWVGFQPHTPLREGLKSFVQWYRHYHGV